MVSMLRLMLVWISFRGSTASVRAGISSLHFVASAGLAAVIVLDIAEGRIVVYISIALMH